MPLQSHWLFSSEFFIFVTSFLLLKCNQNLCSVLVLWTLPPSTFPQQVTLGPFCDPCQPWGQWMWEGFVNIRQAVQSVLRPPWAPALRGHSVLPQPPAPSCRGFVRPWEESLPLRRLQGRNLLNRIKINNDFPFYYLRQATNSHFPLPGGGL